MTYAMKSALAENQEFRGRIQMATMVASGNLLADPTQEFIVHKYASHTINNPNGSWLTNMTHQIISSPAINGESNDGDIQFTVNSVFVKMAKAHYANI